MQVVGKDVEVACLFADFLLAALALLEIIEIRGAVRIDVFCQLVLVDGDCFHNFHFLVKLADGCHRYYDLTFRFA